MHYYIIHEAQGSGWFMNTVRLPNNLKMLMARPSSAVPL